MSRLIGRIVEVQSDWVSRTRGELVSIDSAGFVLLRNGQFIRYVWRDGGDDRTLKLTSDTRPSVDLTVGDE